VIGEIISPSYVSMLHPSGTNQSTCPQCSPNLSIVVGPLKLSLLHITGTPSPQSEAKDEPSVIYIGVGVGMGVLVGLGVLVGVTVGVCVGRGVLVKVGTSVALFALQPTSMRRTNPAKI